MTGKVRGIALGVAAALSIATAADAQPAEGRADITSVVLVHGAFADGSGWRGVYDDLTARGYRVSIVQNPLTSLKDDVDATRRVIDRQPGRVILVGHSWGGTVITEAGVHPAGVSLYDLATASAFGARSSPSPDRARSLIAGPFRCG